MEQFFKTTSEKRRRRQWELGYNARRFFNKPKSDNPYDYGSSEEQRWNDGWETAEHQINKEIS